MNKETSNVLDQIQDFKPIEIPVEKYEQEESPQIE